MWAYCRSAVILITFEKEKNLHVKLTSLSYKLALLRHLDMCLFQRELKSFSVHWAAEGMAQGCYKTTEVKEHPGLTRVVLHTVNILLHWISAALAKVQASLVFIPYLNHKKHQERERPGLNESTLFHWPRVIWILKNGIRRLVLRIIRNNNQFSTS